MNNVPIAWIKQSGYGKPTIVQNPLHQFSYQAESAKWEDVPLYIHPAKEQELLAENDLLKAQVKRLKEIIEKSIDMNNALGKM